MDDATFEQESGRISDLVHKWVPLLGLEKVHFNILTLRDGGDHTERGHHHAAGLTTSMWEYGWAEISFDLSKTQEEDDEHLEFVVLHELMHVMMQGVVDALVPAEADLTDAQRLLTERCATDLAQAFVRASTLPLVYTGPRLVDMTKTAEVVA